MNDFTNAFARRTRNCNQRFIRAHRVGDLAHCGSWSGDFDSADVRSPFRALVVDKADDFHSELRTMLNLTRKRFAGISRADNEHSLLAVRHFLRPEAIAP